MTAARTAESIASIGLDGNSDHIEVPDGVGHELLGVLQHERILGVAVSAFESGTVSASEELISAVLDAHDQVMAQSMRVELMMLRVVGLFHDEGIDYRLLKGSALAHTIAGHPSERSFRDVDLLVPSDAIASAVELLHGVGAARLHSELRPGYDERFAKSVTMKLDGVEVDVHRLLCPGPFGVWMRPSELFLLRQELTIGNRPVRTLDPTNHLLHACYHVALGQVDPVLANLRDIGMLAADSGSLDLERFDDTVRQWRGAAVVKRAVALVEQRLDVSLPDELARYRHVPVPTSELEAVEPYLTDDGTGRFAALAPATLRALPLGDRAAYALAVGLPSGSDPLDRAKSLLKRRR